MAPHESVLDDSRSHDEFSDTSGDEAEEEELAATCETHKPTILQEFQDIVSHFTKKDGSENWPELAKDIASKHKDHLNKTTSDVNRPTLLHMLVESCDDRKFCTRMKPLLKILIRNHPELLQQKDKYNNTPLMLAVFNRPPKLVDYFLRYMDPKNLITVSAQKDVYDENCLHKAVSRPECDFIYKFLDKVSESISQTKQDLEEMRVHETSAEQTEQEPGSLPLHGPPVPDLDIKNLKEQQHHARDLFCGTNKHNLTPLHIAVEYERCTEGQMKLVKALISLCDEALDVNIHTDAPDHPSIYRHHENTRAKSKNKKEGKRKEKSVQSEGVRGNSVPQPANYSSAQRPTGPEIPPIAPGSRNSKNEKQGAREFKEPEHAPSVPQTAKTGLTMRISDDAAPPSSTKDRKPSIAQSSSRDFHNGKPYSAEAESGNSRQLPSTSTKEDTSKERLDAYANEIRDYLRVHYMCTRDDHEKIKAFLYEPNKVKHIYFGLGNESSLTMSWLENMRQFLQFEDTLQYVRLPNFKIDTGPQRRANASRRMAPKEPEGRQDHKIILQWLRDHGNGVKRIVNLHVDDHDDLGKSHSDQTIEEALAGIRVLNIWDWKRPDLNSETIKTAAPEVREVFLYWTGNNSVLRGWSDAEGLNLLENLERVTVYGTKGLETRDRANSYLRSFKDRLEEVRRKTIDDPQRKGPRLPQIKVDIKLEQDFKQSTRVEHEQSEQQHPEPHDWLTTMDDFAEFIQNFDFDHPSKQQIKIAVIDDGIDASTRSLEGKIMGGESFYSAHHEKNIPVPWWTTDGYHGTVMSSLVSRVCPKANLFIVRLDERFSQGKRAITAKSAAKAIRCAINNDVDIISMSWTIEGDEKDPDINSFREAIDLAVKNNILLFCAASDQTGEDRSLPGKSTQYRFKIGAATKFGTTWGGVSDDEVDYIFPGENVIFQRPGDVPINDKCKSSLTGSSVATALASGLAGLVLYCVQFEALNVAHDTPVDGLKQWRQHKTMKIAFDRIGHIPRNNKFLDVKSVFGGTKELRLTYQKEHRIMKVAQQLRGGV